MKPIILNGQTLVCFCIAPDFNKYDEGAINLMPKDIELIKWKLFDKTSLIFEYFKQSSKKANKSVGSSETSQTSFPEKLNSASKKVKELFECINSFLNDELSDDATSNVLKHYRAYKRMKNFACVVVEKEKIVVYLSLDPKEYPVDEGFLRDMTNKGHLGTGDLEITIKTTADFEKSKTYFRASYNNN